MPAELFLNLACEHDCSTHQLRKRLRQYAVHKDGSRLNTSDSNLLFPPSMMQKYLDFGSVDKIVNCSCAMCRPVIVREPSNDQRLIDEIRNEPGILVMLAILIHMGAGFAMRLLYFHGLGRGDAFDIPKVFERNPSLKSQLFQSLYDLLGLKPGSSVDELAVNFCEIFDETEQLFNPPFFQEGEIHRKIPLNSNLPFVNEEELPSGEPLFLESYRQYTFQIHSEFCSSALSVRSHIKFGGPFKANKTAADRIYILFAQNLEILLAVKNKTC